MTTKTATVYRMVMPDHVCPYGLKTVDLLKREGFEVDDHHLKTREETDAFKEQHGVETTPQTFIGGKRIGGYDDVREHVGKKRTQAGDDETSYQPVIAIFGVAFLLGLAISWYVFDTIFTVEAVESFRSIASSRVLCLCNHLGAGHAYLLARHFQIIPSVHEKSSLMRRGRRRRGLPPWIALGCRWDSTGQLSAGSLNFLVASVI